MWAFKWRVLHHECVTATLSGKVRLKLAALFGPRRSDKRLEFRIDSW
jgi:hypothetical protein